MGIRERESIQSIPEGVWSGGIIGNPGGKEWLTDEIALVISSLSGGGAERVAMNLHQHFNRHMKDRVVCELIILNKTGDYAYNGEAVFLNHQYSQNALRKAVYHFYLYRHKLRRLKMSRRYDVVVSFSTLSNLVNIQSKMNEKTVVSVRNYASLVHTPKEQEQLRAQYPKADKVIAVSNQCRNDLIDVFGLRPEQVVTIYNPYQIQHIESEGMELPDEQDLPLFDGDRTVISVGRFSDQKAFWRLIKAVAWVKREIPDIKLVLMGKNEQGSEQQVLMENLVKKFRLENNVFMIGFKQNPYAYMNRSQLFVCCSKYEGFPNALTEAMCLGIPVVSVDCLSGPREILAPELDFSTPVTTRIQASYGVLVPQYAIPEELLEMTAHDHCAWKTPLARCFLTRS
jgi:glycosyltransferase involved in cell wall biosynthesis